MSTIPRGGRPLGFALVALTAAGWGVGWTVFKSLLDVWPPLFARGVCGLVGAATLAMIAHATGRSLAIPRAIWLKVIMAAFVNVVVWMGFTALSLRWLNVSEGTLLTYTMPLWAMLLAWPILREKPGVREIAALAFGLSGVALLVAGPQLAIPMEKFPGIFFALTAAVLFAFGSLKAKEPLPIDPLCATAWMVFIGCATMVLLSLIFEQPQVSALTWSKAAPFLYVALGPMAACYLTWFGALQRLAAVEAAMATLLVPLVGTATAAVWLNEPLGVRAYVSFALIICGVALAILGRNR